VKFPEPTAFLFTLAFDRIISLEVTDEKYEYDKDFAPAGWFKESYGIVRDPGVPVEKVIIRAFGREVNYLRDLPLHHSQKEVATTEAYSDFEMILRPTADFFSPLLARGAAIKVLAPESLANEIKAMHQAAIDLYNQ
jgi:predicted DNA-binding transcriptional regulator YafY